MIELEKDQYLMVKHFLKSIACDTTTAYSIIENRQQGRVFVDDVYSPKTVLFWHYCSFALLAGDTTNEEFNQNLGKLLLGDFENNQKRFALFVNDDKWNNVITNITHNNPQIKSTKRLRFRFNKNIFQQQKFVISNKYEIKEIDKNIIYKLQGRIVPSFSWHTSQSFLEKGKGFCLVDGNNIACTVFSHAIGNNQLEIGIETNLDYRRKGLGTVTAAKLALYALDNGYEPVWGCDDGNIGSAAVAKKLGFEQIDSHLKYVIA